MTKVLRVENVTCKYCGLIYDHKIYITGSVSVCPNCKKRNKACAIGRVAHLKSPILKECENPKCDDGHGVGVPFLFWAQKASNKYCSPECAKEAKKIIGAAAMRKWRKEHPDKVKEYEKRYQDKKKQIQKAESKEYYNKDFWKKFVSDAE